MKKILSFLLTMLMLLGAFSYTALAEEPGQGEVILFDIDEESAAELMEETNEEPFIPETVEKTVFGKDDRVRIYDTSKYPYSAIAYMEVQGECGDTWTGSGFMVNKDRLLTAAHCLVCTKHGKWAKGITFYFGYKSHKNYLYRYNGRWTAWAGNVFSNKKYSTSGDFGCIKLSKNVGDVTGWLGSRWALTDSTVASTYCYYAGYRDGVLRYDSGLPWVLSSEHIAYNMDIQPGNSGGPIFDANYYAIGIIIAENSQYNTGYRLTTNVKTKLDNLN